MLVCVTTARIGAFVSGRRAVERTRCELVPPRVSVVCVVCVVAPTLGVVASDVGLIDVVPPGEEVVGDSDVGVVVGVGVGLGVATGSDGSAVSLGDDGEVVGSTVVAPALGVGTMGRTPLAVAESDGVGETPCVGELVGSVDGEPVPVEGVEVDEPEPAGVEALPDGDDVDPVVPAAGVLGAAGEASSRGSLDVDGATTSGDCSGEVPVVGARGPVVSVVNAVTGDDGRPSATVGPRARTLGRSVGEVVVAGAPAARISACSTC